jgi:hypothetical protein
VTAGSVQTAVGTVEDNSHAGQGAVAVDIGGDYGALVIRAPAGMEGVEIEIRPTGDTPYVDELAGQSSDHPDGHEHDHAHDHPHSHSDDHPHEEGGHRLLHVAVLRRPSTTPEVLFAAVFGSLHRGTYELYRRPAEPVALTATVEGGSVSEVRWPTDR